MSPVLISLGNVHFMCPLYHTIHTAHVKVFMSVWGSYWEDCHLDTPFVILLIKMSYCTGLWYIYSNTDQKLNYAYAFLTYIN